MEAAPFDCISIPVDVRLERPVYQNADIIGLFLGEFHEFDADPLEMQPCHFFVEVFRQTVNANFVRAEIGRASCRERV